MAKYINREELVAWLKRIPLKDLSDGRGLCRIIMEEDFKRAIQTIPAGTIIDVAPVVHGTWVMIGADKRGRGGIWRCSACDRCQPYKSDYCPVCGAKNKSERAGGENGRRADNG